MEFNLLYLTVILCMLLVPSESPSHMEALLLNSSAVYLKWKPPAMQAHNGKLFNIPRYTCVRSLDFHDIKGATWRGL